MTEKLKELLNEFHSKVNDGKVVHPKDKEVLYEIVLESSENKVDKDFFKNEDNYSLYEELMEFDHFKNTKNGKERLY